MNIWFVHFVSVASPIHHLSTNAFAYSKTVLFAFFPPWCHGFLILAHFMQNNKKVFFINIFFSCFIGCQWEQDSWKLGYEETASSLLHIFIPKSTKTTWWAFIVKKLRHVARQRSIATTRVKNFVARVQRCKKEKVVRRSHR